MDLPDLKLYEKGLENGRKSVRFLGVDKKIFCSITEADGKTIAIINNSSVNRKE